MTASRTKKPTPVQRLMAAMDRCAVARGEAQWTNGYRTGRFEKEKELYSKELQQWGKVGDEEKKFRRLAQRLLREASR